MQILHDYYDYFVQNHAGHHNESDVHQQHHNLQKVTSKLPQKYPMP